MLIGTDGKPLNRTHQARAVVYESQDLESWTPMKPYNVPEWVQDDDIMGYLLSGEIVCQDERAPFYRAERIPEVTH